MSSFIRLLVSVVATAVCAGCLAVPFDGERVGRQSEAITFVGLHPDPGAGVAVQAFNTQTGRFETIAPTNSGRTLFTTHFGQPWFQWSSTVTLGEAFWTPGSTGFSARIRGQAIGSPSTSDMLALQEHGLSCMLGSRTLSEAIGRCGALNSSEITICTNDFSVSGSRRGPCPRRTVDVLSATGRVERRHVQADRTSSVVAPPAPRLLAWRGDAASFIDIFDASLATNRDESGGRMLGTPGLAYGNFIRIRYSRGSTDERFDRFDVDQLARALGTATPWAGAVSFRHYDVGECSFFLSWRQTLEVLTPALESSLASIRSPDSDTALELRPLSRAVLTPILRAGGSDAVRFTQSYTVRGVFDPDGADLGIQLLRATFRVVVGLSSSHGSIGATIESVEVSTESSVNPEIARMFEDNAKAAVRTIVPGIIRRAVPVPVVQRVHARPDGLEFILAETVDDPLFAQFRERRLCNRPDPATATPVAGYFDSVFDPSLPGDPPVFGNPSP